MNAARQLHVNIRGVIYIEVFSIFFYLLEFFFFSKRSTNKKPSTEELESISCYLGLKCQITLVRLLAIASHRFLTVYVQVVELLADVFNHLSWMLSPLPFVQVSAKGT